MGQYRWWNRIKGSDVSQWRYKPNDPNTKQIGTCNRDNARWCKPDEDNIWDWTDVVSNEQPAETADNGARNTIKIDSDDICTQKGNSDVCHMYIEHINLTNTDVYIKNDTRAIVLHLNLGKDVNRREDLKTVYGYKLGNGSKICGVNSLSGATPSCNSIPLSW